MKSREFIKGVIGFCCPHQRQLSTFKCNVTEKAIPLKSVIETKKKVTFIIRVTFAFLMRVKLFLKEVKGLD